MATLKQITELFSKYAGFTPSSEMLGKFSMMTPAETEDIIKDTKSWVQKEAAEKAQTSISSLMAGQGEGGAPGVSDYLRSMGEARETLMKQYGVEEAEKRYGEISTFYQGMVQKGPGFGMAMETGLAEISPTFLGANRKDLEAKLSGIGNPFVRDKMIDSYLGYADKAMNMSLSALNTLWNSSIVATRTAAEDERGIYERAAGKFEDAYKELQWINRFRLQEQQTERVADKALARQKELARYKATLEPGVSSVDYLTNQIINRQIDIESPAITKDQRAAIYQNLSNRGMDIPRPLTVAEQNAKDDAVSGLGAIQRIRQLLADDPTILGKAVLPGFIGRMAGAGEFKAVRDEATDVKTRIRTGAALNEQEIDFYADQAPKWGDPEDQIERKLMQLEGFYLGMAGLPVIITNPETQEQFVYPDLFKQVQRLGLRTAINNGWTIEY